MAKTSGRMYDTILIELDEYLKLLNIQQKVKEQERKINLRLANETEAKKSTEIDSLNDTTDESQTSQTGESQTSQTGSGSTSQTGESQTSQTGSGSGPDINLLSELVAKQLEKKFQFVPLENVQQGSGSSDLITEFPQQIASDKKLIDTLPSSSTVQKSTLKDSFDDQRLIKLVPKSSQNKAEKLLDQLQKHPSDITWQSDGTIFLNQSSLFGSNIFDLFPKLFKKNSHPENIPNLLQVASSIATLGLGHLINGFLTRGLTRKVPILNHSELKLKIEHSKNWYFLGE
jgi:hypothetical protein